MFLEALQWWWSTTSLGNLFQCCTTLSVNIWYVYMMFSLPVSVCRFLWPGCGFSIPWTTWSISSPCSYLVIHQTDVIFKQWQPHMPSTYSIKTTILLVPNRPFAALHWHCPSSAADSATCPPLIHDFGDFFHILPTQLLWGHTTHWLVLEKILPAGSANQTDTPVTEYTAKKLAIFKMLQSTQPGHPKIWRRQF